MADTNQFSRIEDALEDFKNGKPLIVADDEDRENEGDLICAAQFATPELINFMAKECRGLICLAISHEIAEKLVYTPSIVGILLFITGFTLLYSEYKSKKIETKKVEKVSTQSILF